MMQRRSFLGLVPGVLAAAGRRKPNILWIMADDLGYSDLGCYGQKKIATPHIDRLAEEGMRFTDAYAGCTVCAPSRSVFYTGKHMGHTSVRSNPGGVPLLDGDVTVGEVLQKAGYKTGVFGKWGLGDIGTDGVPWKQGFDEFFGYLHQVHAHYFYPRYLYRNEQQVPLEGNENGKRVTYSHDVIEKEALGFIRKHKEQSFFAAFTFTLPHWELLVPEDSMGPYRGKFPEDKPYVDKNRHYADQPETRAAYAGMISRLDRSVGRVMDLLRELGLEKDTLVFLTSDNGGAMRILGDDYFESYGPFRGQKQNLYEGGIRVPMIARWPGKIAAGKTSNFAWCSYDFMATAAEVAGVKAPADTDGISVLPTLLGKKQKGHEYLYWEQPAYVGRTGEFKDETPMQALRMGKWKAVRPKANGPLELYDLSVDVGEAKDLAAAEPAVVAKIEGLLRGARVKPRRQSEPAHGYWKQG